MQCESPTPAFPELPVAPLLQSESSPHTVAARGPIAGYALVAYPDKWGNSGVMTFIINQQGRVYEKNLGPNTGKLAASMTEYNPDPSWKLVPTQP